MTDTWSRWLTRWIDAGLLDEAAAARIREFERQHAGASRLRWPIWLALTFGASMMGAGVLLFVSAHWDTLSPDARFALVLLLVSVFHLAGAATADRFPGMATTLHAVGTVALGAGVLLAGQIFNLDEHWPGGLMLWALGAAAAWALLRTWPQLGLVAILAPAWLWAEWFVATGERVDRTAALVPASGIFLLALTYFTAVRAERATSSRRTLLVVGALAFAPAAIALSLVAAETPPLSAEPLRTGLWMLGWIVAIGVPLGLALALRGAAAWPNVAAAFWVVALIALRPIAGEVVLYAWWALGAMALAAWGVGDARSERINLGAAVFGATVVAFYFSQVMDKFGRSTSLIGLGLLFLAGGWAIERARRQLVLQARGGTV